MYYGFPVLSSRDCLMKEPICPTCTDDDGERIYLIFSPSPILDLSWNISGRYLFLRSRFLLQTKRKWCSTSIWLHTWRSIFSLGIFKCLPFSIRRFWSLILSLAISLHFSKFSCNRSFFMLKSLFKSFISKPASCAIYLIYKC